MVENTSLNNAKSGPFIRQACQEQIYNDAAIIIQRTFSDYRSLKCWQFSPWKYDSEASLKRIRRMLERLPFINDPFQKLVLHFYKKRSIQEQFYDELVRSEDIEFLKGMIETWQDEKLNHEASETLIEFLCAKISSKLNEFSESELHIFIDNFPVSELITRNEKIKRLIIALRNEADKRLLSSKSLWSLDETELKLDVRERLLIGLTKYCHGFYRNYLEASNENRSKNMDAMTNYLVGKINGQKVVENEICPTRNILEFPEELNRENFTQHMAALVKFINSDCGRITEQFCATVERKSTFHLTIDAQQVEMMPLVLKVTNSDRVFLAQAVDESKSIPLLYLGSNFLETAIAHEGNVYDEFICQRVHARKDQYARAIEEALQEKAFEHRQMASRFYWPDTTIDSNYAKDWYIDLMREFKEHLKDLLEKSKDSEGGLALTNKAYPSNALRCVASQGDDFNRAAISPKSEVREILHKAFDPDLVISKIESYQLKKMKTQISLAFPERLYDAACDHIRDLSKDRPSRNQFSEWNSQSLTSVRSKFEKGLKKIEQGNGDYKEVLPFFKHVHSSYHELRCAETRFKNMEKESLEKTTTAQAQTPAESTQKPWLKTPKASPSHKANTKMARQIIHRIQDQEGTIYVGTLNSEGQKSGHNCEFYINGEIKEENLVFHGSLKDGLRHGIADYYRDKDFLNVHMKNVQFINGEIAQTSACDLKLCNEVVYKKAVPVSFNTTIGRFNGWAISEKKCSTNRKKRASKSAINFDNMSGIGGVKLSIGGSFTIEKREGKIINVALVLSGPDHQIKLQHTGDWKDNKRHGQGKTVYSDTQACYTLDFNGHWLNDKPQHGTIKAFREGEHFIFEVEPFDSKTLKLTVKGSSTLNGVKRLLADEILDVIHSLECGLFRHSLYEYMEKLSQRGGAQALTGVESESEHRNYPADAIGAMFTVLWGDPAALNAGERLGLGTEFNEEVDKDRTGAVCLENAKPTIEEIARTRKVAVFSKEDLTFKGGVDYIIDLLVALRNPFLGLGQIEGTKLRRCIETAIQALYALSKNPSALKEVESKARCFYERIAQFLKKEELIFSTKEELAVCNLIDVFIAALKRVEFDSQTLMQFESQFSEIFEAANISKEEISILMDGFKNSITAMLGEKEPTLKSGIHAFLEFLLALKDKTLESGRNFGNGVYDIVAAIKTLEAEASKRSQAAALASHSGVHGKV